MVYDAKIIRMITDLQSHDYVRFDYAAYQHHLEQLSWLQPEILAGSTSQMGSRSTLVQAVISDRLLETEAVSTQIRGGESSRISLKETPAFSWLNRHDIDISNSTIDSISFTMFAQSRKAHQTTVTVQEF
jgi:hypothetical protein